MARAMRDVFVPKSENSWGPAIDGQAVTDWTGKSQPLSPQQNNTKDFFQHRIGTR